MTQFNVGDRVVVRRGDVYGGFERNREGREGVVNITDHSSLPVRVRFDDGLYDWGKFEQLQLVSRDASESVVVPPSVREQIASIEAALTTLKSTLGL